MQSSNERWINAPEAVIILNELLEDLEAICDSYSDVYELNDAISSLLRQHGVFGGDTYTLT